MKDLPNLNAARVSWCVIHDSQPVGFPSGLCDAGSKMISAGTWPEPCRFESMRLVPQ